MLDKYILDDDGRPRLEPDLLRWAVWFEQADNRIVKQDFAESEDTTVGVSTIFLGLDHRFFGEGPPILWESMIFGTALNGDGRRYASREAALAGHAELLAEVRAAYQKEQP